MHSVEEPLERGRGGDSAAVLRRLKIVHTLFVVGVSLDVVI